MKELGINISRTTKEQFKEGKEINIMVKELNMLDYLLEIIQSYMLHQLKEQKKMLVLVRVLKLLENFYINIEKDNLYFKLELL